MPSEGLLKRDLRDFAFASQKNPKIGIDFTLANTLKEIVLPRSGLESHVGLFLSFAV